MTQFIKRKTKATIKFKIDDLDEKDTTIKLSNINPAQLDKKYIMKEVKEIIQTDLITVQKPKKTVTKKSDIDKLQTDLENLGISDNKTKNYETIVSNNMKIKDFLNNVIGFCRIVSFASFCSSFKLILKRIGFFGFLFSTNTGSL
jgi:hypothetical protein